MDDYTYGYCGNIGPTSEHHIIFRSQVKALTKCPHNVIRLCQNCHYKIHSTGDTKIQKDLRLKFLNYLQMSFLSDYIEYKDIKDTLQIKDKPLMGILKTVKQKNGLYERESLIRTLMGGFLLPEEEI